MLGVVGPVHPGEKRKKNASVTVHEALGHVARRATACLSPRIAFSVTRSHSSSWPVSVSSQQVQDISSYTFTVLTHPEDVLDALSSQLEQAGEVSGLRFLRLPHPRTGKPQVHISFVTLCSYTTMPGIPSLFLPYAKPSTSSSSHTHEILEIQAVTPPNPRSWFSGNSEVISGTIS
jgi:hypothetical protein